LLNERRLPSRISSALFGLQADRGSILPLPDSKQNRRMRISPRAPMLRRESRIKKILDGLTTAEFVARNALKNRDLNEFWLDRRFVQICNTRKKKDCDNIL
jgi:hypothetical protein